ncbi:hypothetical protein J2W51_006034 [Tardiphaga robiniae]|uniref:hypothetical protein n=1 Tax=Tardiphaga robiniae TaxID=943830 RepID=UPI002864181C|nr:hypothetical protein [Tardiphaga robiniae]MDR6663440.1 hypothetical protein [Tardiphaga robiniae]
MGETTSTIFTILLFVVAFFGSGAYAVLSLADFRAARRGFWATAISFAAIGLVLGIMTTWALPVRIAVCAAFFAVAGGGLIWILDYLNVRQALVTVDQSAPTSLTSAIKSEPEALLDFAFDMLPRVSPANGMIPIFDIVERNGQIEAHVTHYQTDPSVVVDWRKMIPEWPVFGVSKCEVTSATNEPIFNAVVSLTLGFQEMVPDPNHPGQSSSGRLMGVQNAKFNVGRISPHESYVLYFMNRTRYLVNIVVPSEGIRQDFSTAGPDFEKKIRLRLGRKEGLHLTPIVPPPAPPPPASLLPSTSEK